jgi:hypothetical protein
MRLLRFAAKLILATFALPTLAAVYVNKCCHNDSY